MQTNNAKFCFAVKLEGLNMTAVINCTTSDQRKELIREVGKLSNLLTAPGVSIDISKGQEENTSGELH
ncbi:hypothetical protein UFOVP592_8 [uncultured Caudovirales phage]|uniref:Uncharacterized protein n=1 Tax=uncultured Caudovirales phage TaxID=2100421 RepID=A0A6J5N1X0_9CAUD|nr:hypothetical protein UFOVP592_8 [uncultured Caudovirales phage]